MTATSVGLRQFDHPKTTLVIFEDIHFLSENTKNYPKQPLESKGNKFEWGAGAENKHFRHKLPKNAKTEKIELLDQWKILILCFFLTKIYPSRKSFLRP